MTSQDIERDAAPGARRPYRKPEAITYGTVTALAMGGGKEEDDSKNPHNQCN